MAKKEQRKAAQKFVKGMRVKFVGGSSRLDLKKGTAMLVEGLKRNRGRMYVRCRFADRTDVAISPRFLTKA
jgi:hypothetical protein